MLNEDTKALIATLEAWMAEKLPATELSITDVKGRSGAGFSAETFYISVSCKRDGKPFTADYAVRCQNQESDLFVGASIELPYRVMKTVGQVSDIPVPGVVGLEMDDSLIGQPFLVMEKMPGRVVAQSPNYNTAGWVKDLPVEERGKVWFAGLEAIAKVNRLSWQPDFEFLRNPAHGEPGLSSYLAWVNEWYQWMRGQGEPIPLMDKAIDYLLNQRPEAPQVSVLWGDPNSSNILFADDLTVGTVLDWEMASLGTAEVDLAWWLFFDDLFSTGFGVERMEGLPNREESIAFYESKLGRSVENMDYYDLLATFRMCIVGIRAVDRQILLGAIPKTTTARQNQPLLAMLAAKMGEPIPEVGEDFVAFSKAIGM